MIPVSQRPSCWSRTKRAEKHTGRENGWLKNSLRLFRDQLIYEMRRCRYRGRPPSKQKRKSPGSTCLILLLQTVALRCLDLAFEVRRPCLADQQPQCKRGEEGKSCVIGKPY